MTQALNDSMDDIKQTLHIAPGAFQNFLNIYQPAQGTFTGAIAINNFANPISFLCGAIQAASRLGAEQSAKLCVQYLAPIIKNRQYNFLPIGENLFVGAQARPNEITYSEDWMRPDYVPPAGTSRAARCTPAPARSANALRRRCRRRRQPRPRPTSQPTNPARRSARLDGAARGGIVMARALDAELLTASALAVLSVAAVSACASWHGVNSLPLPGTQGNGPGAFTIQAQLPDVANIERNSRVRVGDVTVGNVSKIERQGWHALVTMTLNGDVKLPANATAKIGQTSLLGSLHIELAPPTDVPPQGSLHEGSMIPLSSGAAFPSTEQTLAAVSLLLNGGGIGQIQDITQALSVAFAGRENDLRSLIQQLDKFVGYVNDQKDDIIAAADSLNNLVGQFAAQKPVVDKALKTIPDALSVLKDQRDNLSDALDQLGQIQCAGGRFGEPDQGESGQGTLRPRTGAAIAGRRRSRADTFVGSVSPPSRSPRTRSPSGCAATTPT